MDYVEPSFLFGNFYLGPYIVFLLLPGSILVFINLCGLNGRSCNSTKRMHFKTMKTNESQKSNCLSNH